MTLLPTFIELKIKLSHLSIGCDRAKTKKASLWHAFKDVLSTQGLHPITPHLPQLEAVMLSNLNLHIS